MLFFYSMQGFTLQPAPMSFPFPIEHYDQTISDYIKSGTVTEKPSLDPKVVKSQYENFIKKYLFPWSDEYHAELSAADLKPDELKKITDDYSDSRGRMSCDPASENFNTLYPNSWVENFKTIINSSQFEIGNSAQGKGIALDNLHMRALPTDDRYFHDCNTPGEGDSFDYMQMSALWAGTSVYIIAESPDHNWYLVRSPDVTAWVKKTGIKRVSDEFVSVWTKAANSDHSLIAVNSPINTKPLVIADDATQTKRFSGYMGAVFPLDFSIKSDGNGFHILIPVQESDLPVTAYLPQEDASVIPLLLTEDNRNRVINNMIGRPYGWGSVNMENTQDFLNDCSQELKSFFTPFGIWLPRGSAAQVDPSMIVGAVDQTFPAGTEERIAKLVKDADKHPFTIVNIHGHIFMYLGSYENVKDPSHTVVPLTYQNMWGLKPMSQDGRYVIGKAVLFPLLSHYPEKYPAGDLELSSPASKAVFIVAYLDQLPHDSGLATNQLWSGFGMGSHATNKLRSLDHWYSMQPTF